MNKLENQQTQIAVKGAYGLENFGDDALMVAVYEIVKRIFDSGSIVFICRDSEYLSKMIPNVGIAENIDMITKPLDLIIYGGGTQFYSFPLSGSSGKNSLIYRIVRNLASPIKFSQKLRRRFFHVNNFLKKNKVIAIGIGLGPFIECCKLKNKTRKIFEAMNYVAVRDTYSYELCKTWECANVSLRSDLCYMPGLWEVPITKKKKTSKNPIKKIGVVVRDWPHSEEGNSYSSSLFQVVNYLREKDKTVDFISFANRYDVKWKECLKRRNEKMISWEPQQMSIQDFLTLLSEYDVIISARYHGAVFASLLGIPVVCIEVEQKLRLVQELLGEGARLWTYPFSSIECLNHLSELESGLPLAKKVLARVVEEQGVLVDKMVNELSNMSARGMI